jgi:hypothetical protein
MHLPTVALSFIFFEFDELMEMVEEKMEQIEVVYSKNTLT